MSRGAVPTFKSLSFLNFFFGLLRGTDLVSSGPWGNPPSGILMGLWISHVLDGSSPSTSFHNVLIGHLQPAEGVTGVGMLFWQTLVVSLDVFLHLLNPSITMIKSSRRLKHRHRAHYLCGHVQVYVDYIQQLCQSETLSLKPGWRLLFEHFPHPAPTSSSKKAFLANKV